MLLEEHGISKGKLVSLIRAVSKRILIAMDAILAIELLIYGPICSMAVFGSVCSRNRRSTKTILEAPRSFLFGAV